MQSELIHDAIRRASKETGVPVYSFAEDVAASGGYWLLCAGDKSYACSTSIVGSVGVISATFGAVDAAKKIGIERRVFTSGDEKLPLDPFLPVTSEQVSCASLSFRPLTELRESVEDDGLCLWKASVGRSLCTE